MQDTAKFLNWIKNFWKEKVIDSLSEYIKIPNLSEHFDANWELHGHMEKAIQHIASWCKKNAPIGMSLDIIRLPHKAPLLFIEIDSQSKDTVLLYGHLDKQPPMDGWHEGLQAFKPVLKDGLLYGRGAADDGYAIYAIFSAILGLQKFNLSHPRCVILIEASEESGSVGLVEYLECLKPRIGEPKLVLALDSGAGNYSQWWLTNSLRGNIVGNLTVSLLKEAMHSGAGSGIVADSFRVTRQILERIEDTDTGLIKLPQLYPVIPDIYLESAKKTASLLGENIYKDLALEDGVFPVNSSPEELLLNKTFRPALTITGVEGLEDVNLAGNVLRTHTKVKLSLRIPPYVDKDMAAKVLEDALLDSPPYGAKVSFELLDKASGWASPLLPEWLQVVAQEASENFFGESFAYIGEGGTIPFMAMLGETFKDAHFIITGVLGPKSNAHGPNEFLHLDCAQKVSACIAYVLEKFKN